LGEVFWGVEAGFAATGVFSAIRKILQNLTFT